MNHSEIDELLAQAASALHRGDSANARAYVLKASQLHPQSEQTWLALASLSEPEQALMYIENALRVNPQSQAARKAIRLVYRQMADQERKPKPGDLFEKPNDSSTIPAVVTNVRTVEKTTEEQAPAIQSEAEDPSQESIEKKKRLLRNLRKKSAPVEPAPSAPPPNIRLVKKSAPHARLTLFRGKPAIPPESQTEQAPALAAMPAERLEPELETPKLEDSGIERLQENPQRDLSIAEPESTKAKKSGKAPGKKPAAPRKSRPSPKPEAAFPQPARPKKIIRENKIAAVQSKAKPVRKEKPSRKASAKRNHREPVNVDTIELILISTAAILIPLMVFLYFYFTK